MGTRFFKDDECIDYYDDDEISHALAVQDRLKKELSETEEYLNNYPQYEGSGTVEVKKRILPILQKILGKKK